MKKRNFRVLIGVFCVVLLAVTLTSNIFAKGDIIRPYTFGFGSAEDVDEGVYDLVESGDLKHLTFVDSNENAINYWIHVPKNENNETIENLPVVLYMHGYSDGGGENNLAIRYHNALLFKLIKDQDIDERKAIVIVPQTPNNVKGDEDRLKAQWVGIGPDEGEDEWTQWNEETWDMEKTPRTDNLNAVVELLKKVQKENKADVDRAYVSGISMGGYATWDLISRDDSNLFAAAVPICGVGDPTKIDNVKNVPIRTYHGSKDTVIEPKSTRRMYSELRKYGNITFKEYEDEEHPSWNSAYSPTMDDDNNGVNNLDDMINWMFNQSRNGTLDGSVDKEPLKQIINDAKEVDKKEYNNDDWNALQTSIKNAEEALNPAVNEEITKKAVEQLDSALLKTIKSEESKQQNTNNDSQTTTYIVIGGIVLVAAIGFVVIRKRKR